MNSTIRFTASALVAVIATALSLPVYAVAQPCTEPMSAIFERVSPAVVSINAIKISKVKPQNRFTTVMGSGFIVDGKGQVLTNAHVVDGATSISVTLDSGDQVEGRTIGLDPVLDLALLQVASDKRLPAVILGDSGKIKVGDEVVAIGNPLGLDQTMTRWIVSGIKGPDDFRNRPRLAKPGQPLRLTISRDGASQEVTLSVADRPRQPYDLPPD